MVDDLRRLAADLRDAGAGARPFVRKALQVSAHHVKDAWRKDAARTGLRKYAADVTYETRELPDAIVAEVGPTANGDSGSFGFVEEAPGGVRSAPQFAGRDALKAVEPDFVRGLSLAVDDALRAVGL